MAALGPSLPIATCLMLAIRTAKRPAIKGEEFSEVDSETEIAFCAPLARRVLAVLITRPDDLPRAPRALYLPN